jgi:DNA-directed RNA polymerase subunit omega
LGRGAAPSVDPENDKKPVIALREIGESKIAPTELEESIVNKLRRIPDYQEEEEDLEEVDTDTFRQMYQGGLSKSEMEKSATRKFTARIPKIEPKLSKESEEVNSSLENDASTNTEDSIETLSTEEEPHEDVVPKEENIEKSVDENTSDNADVVEENQLSEDIAEISPSDELSIENDPVKED